MQKKSIGNSVSYRIGGKEYNATDISQLKSKPSCYKTDNDLNVIRSEIQSTPRIVESIKTNVDVQIHSNTPVQPYQTIPVQQTQIKTQSVINQAAVQKVQNQTDSYYKPKVYSSSQLSAYKDRKLNLSSIQIGSIGNKVQSSLSQQTDLGTESVGMGVSGGLASVQAFKTSQKITEIAPNITKNTANGLYNVGRGMYQVALTGGLAVITVSRTATMIQTMKSNQLNHDFMQMLKVQASLVGLNKTDISQKIIHSVTGIHNRIQNGIQTTKQIGHTIKTGYHGVKYGAETGKKLITNGITKGLFNGIPKTASLMRGGVISVAGIMQGTDDWVVQGAGTAIQATDVGLNFAFKGTHLTKNVLKTAIKRGVSVGRSSLAATRFIKNQGLRAAWNVGRRKAVTAIANAGRSMVTAIINAIKALGSKVIIPILIVILVAMAFNGIVVVPVTAVSSIFSSMFTTSDTNTDYDVRAYLNSIIPTLSTNFQQDLADQIKESADKYDIVRFYSNTGSEGVIEPTLSGISSVFPTTEELLNMMQPIFNAIVLMQYDLEPTETEVETLTEEIFNKLFTVTTNKSDEYCGQDLITGEGTVNKHSCGSIHALSDCPRTIKGTHSKYTCSGCCYYYCNGHKGNINCGRSSHSHSSSCYSGTTKTCGKDSHSHSEWYSATSSGCYSTTYCSGCTFDCKGYTFCGGHTVISYTLTTDGIYKLEAEYFLDPIEELANKPSRTEDEETKLQELKDYHEIFQEMMSQVAVNYGGGLTMADLSGVVFVNGSRTPCQAIIDLALSQVGQTGGQPYWSYYGFSSRVEWCACFVHWCMRNTSAASGSYPQTSNNAYCQTVANNFKSIGQWGHRGYTDLIAGDTIFFDWQGDGHTDHIGLVIGTDGTKVYTVEGNSGDAVKVKSYPINSSLIYGYGLMNY